jgi:hypothetical protein
VIGEIAIFYNFINAITAHRTRILIRFKKISPCVSSKNSYSGKISIDFINFPWNIYNGFLHSSEGRTQMNPWVIDARDIRGKGDFNEEIIHKTPEISKYLSPENDGKFFLVATKGFGKTLLLKSKRLSFNGSGVRWIPEDQLVDKPAGDSHVYSDSDVTNILNEAHYWHNIWIISIIAAVLKYKVDLLGDISSPSLMKIIHNKHLLTVTDLFSNIISIPRREYFQLTTDIRTSLVPGYRQYQSQVAIFIDNVDEYFDLHLQNPESSASVTGELRKDFWYNAQIGLVTAIYELSSINQHIKIFCSIRKEAFSKLLECNEKGQQISGSAIDITYGKNDLLEIFINNVKLEPSQNLLFPKKRNKFEAFLGSSLSKIRHQYTGEEESIEDYIVRHTLGRARDIIEIGSTISKIRPKDRNERSVKEAINEAGTKIAKQYLLEINPHVGMIHWGKLFSMITSNILKRTEIEKISIDYDNETNTNSHIFCSLYKIGLLGYLDRPYGEKIQIFTSIGSMTFASNGVLPISDFYVLHPVLDAIIRQHSPRFRYNYNKWNIAGNGRKWIAPDDKFCVVKGDVQEYSKIMSDPDLSGGFSDFFKNKFTELTEDFTYAVPSQGDSFMIIDVNAVKIIESLKKFSLELKHFKSDIKIRVGGDFGPVLFSDDGKEPRSGQSLRISARIEPIAHPDSLFITERFAKKLQQFGWGDYKNLMENDIQSEFKDGKFNLSKSQADPEVWEKLFCITLL